MFRVHLVGLILTELLLQGGAVQEDQEGAGRWEREQHPEAGDHRCHLDEEKLKLPVLSVLTVLPVLLLLLEENDFIPTCIMSTF